jgi:hypothetical protein
VLEVTPLIACVNLIQSSNMSLKSDVNVDPAKFDRRNIDQETLDFNEKLIKIWADGPRWYEVGTLSIHNCTHTSASFITSPLPIPSPLSLLTSPRSVPQPTANSAGKAKPHFPNPSFLRMASTAPCPHVTTAARFRTACSSPRARAGAF